MTLYKASRISSSIGLAIIACSEMTIASFTIESGETLSLSDLETFQIEGSLTIDTGGTLNAGIGSALHVSDNWNNNGHFNPGTSSVYLADGSATTTISGDNAFYNLTIESDEPDPGNRALGSTNGKTLVFVPNATQTILNNLSIQGSADTLIELRSSNTGTQYNAFDISTANSVEVSFVDVQDAIALNGTINPTDSIDSGNNINWFAASYLKTIGMYPADNAILDSTDTPHLSLRFSSDIEAASDKFLRVFRDDGSLMQTLAVGDSSRVGIDQNVVRIELDALPADTRFFVELEEGAFLEAGGVIRSQAISGSAAWNFSAAPPNYASERSLTLDKGIVPLDETSAHFLDPNNDGNQDDSPIASLIAKIDPGQPHRGYREIAGQTALASITHTLDVRRDDGRVEAYIDTSSPADGVPDLLWDPDANTLERVNLRITHALDAENKKKDATSGVGLPLGDANAVAIASATPGLSGVSDDADHTFRVWAYSGGEFQPVTGWLSADGNDWELAPDDYILPLDIGANLAILRGSASLPLAMNAPASVKITKTVNRKEVSVGGIVTYTITAENLTRLELAAVNIVDDIPSGFKYLEGSAHLEGAPAEPEGMGTGVLTFDLGPLQAGSEHIKTLRYQLMVGAGVNFGRYTNTAVATMPDAGVGSALSAPDNAQVEVVVDALFDLSTIIGKVFFDRDGDGYQDSGEPPVPYARIVTADGRQVTTDADGRYHIAGALPGRHVLRLDERSLPAGSALTTRKALIVNVRPGLPAKANFGVLLKSDDVLDKYPLNIQTLPGEPRPRLSVSHVGPAMLNAGGKGLQYPLAFRLFSNYSSYFDRWELEILEPFSKRVIARRAGARDDFFEPALWDGEELEPLDLKPGKTLAYRLRVSDAEGRSDITREKQFQLSAFDKRQPQTPPPESHWMRQESRQDQSDKREIPIQGQAVQIYGDGFDRIRAIGDNATLLTVPVFTGPLTAADILSDGTTFAPNERPRAELILPYGQINIEALASTGYQESGAPPPLKSESNPGVYRSVADAQKPLQTSIASPAPRVVNSRVITIGPGAKSSKNDLFLVALIDGEIHHQEISGNMETATSGDRRFKDRVWKDGKVAVYLKGAIKGKYLITASYDSERGDEDLFRQLDPDDVYPIYGDGSITQDLAEEADGKLYLLLEGDNVHFKWGRYSTALTETDLARFQRNLQGGKLHYRSEEKTSYGDAATTVIGFNARARQKASRDEFQATGGSLYYLKNQDIVADSLQLQVQARDRTTGDVLSSAALTPEVDYEVDASAGRVSFWHPVKRYVDSGLLTSSDADTGNLVYIVANYSYFVIDGLDKGVSGGRVEQALTDAVRLGASYVDEDQNATRYALRGLDGSIHLGEHASINLEYAETQGRGVSNFVSTDGGLTWGIEEPINPQDEADSGSAWSIKGDASFLQDRLSLDYYYRQVGDEFSTSATDHEQGKKGAGLNLFYGLSDNTGLRYKHDSQWLINEGSQEAQLQVDGKEKHTDTLQLQYDNGPIRLTGEYRHQDIVRNSSEGRDTDGDLLAIGGTYQWSQSAEISAVQQISLKGEANNQTRVEVRKQLTEALDLGGRVATGSKGAVYEVDAGYQALETLRLNGGFVQDSDGSKLTLGSAYQPHEQRSYRASVAQIRKQDKDIRHDLLFGSSWEMDNGFTFDSDLAIGLAGDRRRIGKNARASYALDEEREVYADLSRYKQGKAQETSNGSEIEIGGDLNADWTGFLKAGRGYVHRLDGERDSRNNYALGLAYIRQDPTSGKPLLQARLLLEAVEDRGATNRDSQLAQLDVKGQLNRDWSLFSEIDWGRNRNTDTNLVDARNNRFDLGFAYRPVDNDVVNLIGKYSWVDNKAPEGQDSIAGLQADKGHVFATDILWDVNRNWQLGGTLAYRQGEEKIEFLPWARTQTSLVAPEIAYRFNADNRLSLEWRRLVQKQAKDRKDGAVVEYSRRFNDHIKVGIGYNFAGFNDDLGELDYTVKGIYIRVTGVLVDQEENKRE